MGGSGSAFDDVTKGTGTSLKFVTAHQARNHTLKPSFVVSYLHKMNSVEKTICSSHVKLHRGSSRVKEINSRPDAVFLSACLPLDSFNEVPQPYLAQVYKPKAAFWKIQLFSSCLTRSPFPRQNENHLLLKKNKLQTVPFRNLTRWLLQQRGIHNFPNLEKLI